MSSRTRRAVGLCLLLLGFCTGSVFAVQSVTLAWNPSSSPGIAGYNVYYGTVSRDYTHKVSVTNATSATISGLVEGKTYYFAVTAFDVVGLESLPSNEVAYTVPVPGIRLNLSPVQLTGGSGVTMRLTSTNIIPYAWRLQTSTNLQTWQTATSGSNTPVSVSVTNSDAPALFFRVAPR